MEAAGTDLGSDFPFTHGTSAEIGLCLHVNVFTGPELSSGEEPQRHCPNFLGASGLSWR